MTIAPGHAEHSDSQKQPASTRTAELDDAAVFRVTRQSEGRPVLGNQTVIALLRQSTGRALDAALRADMEQRFGESFADVRVHDDSAAGESALSAGARAYTVGRDVVFANGYFEPASAAGRALLTHELAHVAQQRRGGSGQVSAATAEHEADGVEESSGPAAVGSSAPVGVARQEMTAEERQRQEAKAAGSAKEPESLESMEARFFNPMNASARSNLARVIESLGGQCYDAEKVPYDTLMAEYQRMKAKAATPRYTGPSIGPGRSDGVSYEELQRQQRLRWENLSRYAKEPGSWIATGTLINGTPDAASRALNDAQALTGLAASTGAIGQARAEGARIRSLPENQARRDTVTDQPVRTQSPTTPAAAQTATAKPGGIPPAPVPTAVVPGATAATGVGSPFWRKAELAAVKATGGVDLNTVSKSNFAGLDVVSAEEMSSVKAYSGPTAISRNVKDLQVLSGGSGQTGPYSKVDKATRDIAQLSEQMAKSGKSLPLPAGYAADPPGYIRQHSVLRIPDDLVGPTRNAIISDLTNPDAPFAYQNYGLAKPVSADEAQSFAASRIKGVGMTSEQLVQ